MKTKTFRNVLCAAMTGCALLNPLHTTTTMAQKQFTLEDLNFGGTNYRNMVPENRYTTWWGDRLVRTEVDYCAEVNLKNGKETRLFSLDEINEWAGLKGSDEKIRHFYSASFPYADKSLVMVMNGRERKHVVLKHQAPQVVGAERGKDAEGRPCAHFGNGRQHNKRLPFVPCLKTEQFLRVLPDDMANVRK